MHIYLDAQPLLGPKSGIARYVKNLHDHLKLFHDLDVTLAFNRILKNIDIDLTDADVVNRRYPYKVIRRLMKPNLLYEFPFDLFRSSKPDIFHGTNFTRTPIFKGKTVITIHDLAYMRYPETTSKRILNHHSKWVPFSAKKSDRIIVVSKHTKRDVIELLNIPEEKIDVVYLAAEEHFRPMQEENVLGTLKNYNLPNRYILFVGTLEPRKNLIGLLKSYLLLKQNYGTKEKLVIVGAKGWKYSPIFEWIQQNRLEKEVLFTGFIADQDLVALYNGAAVFVMPSIYEGFGIPLLEAMQCGIPVLGSNTSSIPEVVGDAGILVDPKDNQRWAEEIYRMLADESHHRCYSKKSLEQAQKFSWSRTAYETRLVYDKISNM
jgi:glycosyltransferase involved in cell wall biosynthesis